jgi:hypothetical protein
MSRRARDPWLWRPAAPPLLALLLLATGGPCRGQGVPVIDASAIATAKQSLTALQQQLQQLQALVQTAQSLTQAVGSAGPSSVLLHSSLPASGIGAFSSAVATTLGGGGSSTLSPVLAQLGRLAGGTLPPADFSSFAAAQRWVGAALTTAPGASASAKTLGRQARETVAGEAAADGLALALTARQQIAGMAGRAQGLSTQIAQATTLRQDMEANTAVMLALHDELAQIQALMAALLAIQASDQLAAADDRSAVTVAAP